jgi:hypothetical protein
MRAGLQDCLYLSRNQGLIFFWEQTNRFLLTVGLISQSKHFPALRYCHLEQT